MSVVSCTAAYTYKFPLVEYAMGSCMLGMYCAILLYTVLCITPCGPLCHEYTYGLQ